MKQILAILCTLALMLSALSPAVFAAENSSLQAAKDDDSSEIIVLEEDTSNLTVDRDTYLDLNGHSIDGVTVTGGTLYIMDSATADYTVADGVYGHVTDVTGNVKAAEGYLQVGDSFHAVNLDIYAMTLRAADVGVYYKSNFAADEVVAAQVESFGVALSVVTAPNADNLDTYCGYSVFTGFEAGEGANATGTSTLLKGIMKAANGDNKNAKNAAMPIYGSAYIKTAEGYVFGETVKRSLQEQVEAIDGVWASLTESQKAPVLGMLESYTAVMEGWNIPNIRGIQVPGAEGEIEIDVPVNAENGIVTEAVTVEQNGVSVTVPAGVKLAEGAEALTLTITPKETSDTGIQLEKNEVLMPMDVHVEGLAADNAQPLTIYLGKIMPENLNMGNYAVYHVENGKANEMTLIPVDAEFTAHNQYKYSLDGELTLYVANFSEFAARATTDNTWNGGIAEGFAGGTGTQDDPFIIRNADQLAYLNKQVSGGNTFSGQYIKLLSDLNFGGRVNAQDKAKIWYPIGYWAAGVGANKAGETEWYTYGGAFSGTFDGNGNTISNIHQNTWALDGNYDNGYWNEAMGLFGYISGGTVKNLTMEGFTSEGEFTPTGVIAAYASNSTFENISLTNCNPGVYNTGNGGIVGIGGNSDDPDTYKLTFTNITIDNSNKITALWGSWDVACGGLVGMFRGAGHVYMTNCHVAAQIDVYNDVCGNYQYYWYRYSGMLIGTNKNMVTDANGYTVPETKNFHAENCTVHFGDWNNYWYCELVANSLASYTHDHQFSRLTRINDLNEIKSGDTWLKTGNFLLGNTCYHIVSKDGKLVQHLHEDAGTEVVNGATVLKENNQVVYLPFNQLFTGYGWGVKHIPIYNDKTQNVFPGVTILDREVADSVQKFEAVGETEYVSGNVLTIDQLFAAKADAKVDIVKENVQVTVSPADDQSTASGTYVANAADWTKGTLKFSGIGAATITITDYYFCTPTTITVTVKPVAQIGEVEYASLQNALDAAQNGDTITLLENADVSQYLDIYTPNFGEIERSIILDLNEKTIAPAADYQYKWYPLVFVGINQTLTIKNGTIVSDEHTAIGVYGSLNLEGVDIERTITVDAEESVCIWNWGEDDKYYEDCQYLLTGSATITGGDIAGGILVEGPVTLAADAKFDKLYLNTATGRGKYILPTGYGLVKENDYYTNLHEHTFSNNICKQAGCGLTLSYVKTDLAEITSTDIVVITMSKGDTVYALSSANGTKDGPEAKILTVTKDKISSGITSDLEWNVSKDSDNLVIYPNGSTATWLYCTNENDGVRVGTNINKVFKIDATSGYLKHVDTSRYIGVYTTNPDWRCYTTVNSNIQNQTLAFYVLKTNCNHRFAAEREAVAPTCTEAGHEAGMYCSECDTYISGGELINATDHAWGEWKSVKEATCTEKGKQVARCTLCSKTTTKTFYAPHTEVAIGEAIEATCTTTGMTAGVKCSVCDATIKAQEEISAKGHSYGEGQITTNAGCETPGVKTYTCSVCNNTDSEKIPAIGHSFVDGICKNCGEENTTLAGTYYIAAKRTAAGSNVYYMTNALTTSSTKRYAAESTTLTAVPDKITSAEIDKVFVVEESDEDGEYYIYADGISEDEKYLGWTSDNSGAFVAKSNAKSVKITTENGAIKITFDARKLTLNNTTGNNYFAWYASEQANVYLIPVIECKHSFDAVVTGPTCGDAGYTTYTCSACGYSYNDDVVPATGDHDYVDGVCSECGAEDPDYVGSVTEQTVTMSIYANKGTLSNKVITWTSTSDDVRFQNAQGSSTTAIRTDDSDHYRLYAKSTATVSVAGNGKITRIVFTCTSSNYADVLETSLKNFGYTATVSGSVVTVELDGTADKLSFTLSAQSRINKIEVTYNG